MFFPEGRIRVFLCRVPVDLRKSFDGLSVLVRHALAQDPLSGHCFVFVNRRATQIRVLYWDRTGYSLWAKRLELWSRLVYEHLLTRFRRRPVGSPAGFRWQASHRQMSLRQRARAVFPDAESRASVSLPAG